MKTQYENKIYFERLNSQDSTLILGSAIDFGMHISNLLRKMTKHSSEELSQIALDISDVISILRDKEKKSQKSFLNEFLCSLGNITLLSHLAVDIEGISVSYIEEQSPYFKEEHWIFENIDRILLDP